MADVVLCAERLTKAYAGAAPGVRAVDAVDLAVRAGEFVGIMGKAEDYQHGLIGGATAEDFNAR